MADNSETERREMSYMLGFVDGWVIRVLRHGDPTTLDLGEVENVAGIASELFRQYGADPENWVDHVMEIAELFLEPDFDANAT